MPTQLDTTARPYLDDLPLQRRTFRFEPDTLVTDRYRILSNTILPAARESFETQTAIDKRNAFLEDQAMQREGMGLANAREKRYAGMALDQEQERRRRTAIDEASNKFFGIAPQTLDPLADDYAEKRAALFSQTDPLAMQDRDVTMFVRQADMENRMHRREQEAGRRAVGRAVSQFGPASMAQFNELKAAGTPDDEAAQIVAPYEVLRREASALDRKISMDAMHGFKVAPETHAKYWNMDMKALEKLRDGAAGKLKEAGLKREDVDELMSRSDISTRGFGALAEELGLSRTAKGKKDEIVIDDTADDAEKSFTGGSKAFKAAHDYAMLQSVINGRGISRAKREELLGPEAYRKAGAAGTGAATGGRSDSDAYVNTALGQRP